MKCTVLLLLLCAVVAFATPASAQTYETLFAFTGFDYQDPNPSNVPDPVNHTDYLAVGEGYNIVSFVTSFGPLLTPWVDPSTYEYTHYLYNAIVTSHTFGFGFLEVHFASGALSRYYRDPLSGGTHGTYGTFPPNATSPSTFIDGSMRLGGTIGSDFTLVYDFTGNQGNISGSMTIDTGPDIIYVPSGQRAGWTLAGQAGRPNATVPDGYDNQVSGECKVLSVPVTHKTWGALKALYR